VSCAASSVGRREAGMSTCTQPSPAPAPGRAPALSWGDSCRSPNWLRQRKPVRRPHSGERPSVAPPRTGGPRTMPLRRLQAEEEVPLRPRYLRPYPWGRTVALRRMPCDSGPVLRRWPRDPEEPSSLLHFRDQSGADFRRRRPRGRHCALRRLLRRGRARGLLLHWRGRSYLWLRNSRTPPMRSRFRPVRMMAVPQRCSERCSPEATGSRIPKSTPSWHPNGSPNRPVKQIRPGADLSAPGLTWRLAVGVAGFEPTTSSSRIRPWKIADLGLMSKMQVRASGCIGLRWCSGACISRSSPRLLQEPQMLHGAWINGGRDGIWGEWG
jgi:hypothetical protein